MSFGLEDKDLAKWGPVRNFLWDFENKLFGSVSPARSGFISTTRRRIERGHLDADPDPIGRTMRLTLPPCS